MTFSLDDVMLISELECLLVYPVLCLLKLTYKITEKKINNANLCRINSKTVHAGLASKVVWKKFETLGFSEKF